MDHTSTPDVELTRTSAALTPCAGKLAAPSAAGAPMR